MLSTNIRTKTQFFVRNLSNLKYNGSKLASSSLPITNKLTIRNMSTNNTKKLFRTDEKAAQTGFSTFLSKVYSHAGWGVTGTMGLSVLFSTMEPNLGCLIVGAVGMFASSYAITKIKYVIKCDDNGNYYSEQPTNRKLAFGSLITSTALMISPMTSMVMQISPSIIPMSLGITAAITGGAYMYAKKNPTSLLSYEPVFYGTLTGFVGMGLLSLGSGFIFGFHNPLVQMWFSVDPYIGIGLFSGLIAFDTQKAIEQYKQRDPDYLGCATMIYLDMINVLIRIMELLARSKRD